jgi:hypothetical protein
MSDCRYDNVDQAPDVTVLWERSPVARIVHLCDRCNDEIAPGTRYCSTGLRVDGVFEYIKTHVGAYRYPSGCPSVGARDRADEAAQFKADRALFPDFPMEAQA